MSSSVVYVYCLVKAARRPSLAAAPAGMPGAGALEALQVSPGLWLVVADVPLSVYGPEPLAARLRDLDWVSEAAVSHEAVVERCSRLRTATTVPMKMFTMFSSRERAVADVRDSRRELAAVIKRIAGAEEWGVRVALEPGSTGGETAARRPAGGGTAFLAAKKQARDSARDAVRLAAQTAAESFARLSRLARASTRRDDVPAGAPSAPLLDAAFLVPHARRARFRAAARKAARACRRAGASMVMTGPWPAYSFVSAHGQEPER